MISFWITIIWFSQNFYHGSTCMSFILLPYLFSCKLCIMLVQLVSSMIFHAFHRAVVIFFCPSWTSLFLILITSSSHNCHRVYMIGDGTTHFSPSLIYYLGNRLMQKECTSFDDIMVQFVEACRLISISYTITAAVTSLGNKLGLFQCAPSATCSSV